MTKLSRAFVASALAGLFLASSANAATSDSVGLSGTVTSTLSISATPTAGASALDLSGGSKIVKVADLAISTNNEQGFTLTASSASLTKSGGTSIAYQVTSVDDAASAPAGAAFTIASGSNYTFATSAAGAGDQDLYIKYNPATLQDPGTYTSTINLTVSDN